MSAYETEHDPCTEEVCDCLEHICGRTACGSADGATLCDGKPVTKAAPSLADELTQRMNALRMNAGDQKTSVEDEKDARTADEKAARIAAAKVEAASIRAMMNRVVKAAPSLADDIVTMLAKFPDDDMVITAVSAREALAALRAVEAVRAFPTNRSCERCGEAIMFRCIGCYGYRDGVEAVQALLEGER